MVSFGSAVAAWVLLLAVVVVGKVDRQREVVASREGLVRTTVRNSEDELPSYARAKPALRKNADELPAFFDWSNVNGINFLTPSWNQHIPTYCGSCYLHASLSAAQDRIKVVKNAEGPDVMLARQAVLNCIADKDGINAGGESDGCRGGTALDVYRYMHDVGVPDETCNSYLAKESKRCDAKAVCVNCMPYASPILENFNCWGVENFVTYSVSEFGLLPMDEQAIMSEIEARGPVACSIASFDEFDYDYMGGVWMTNSSATEEVNHIVEITGWGVTDDGVKFWQVRNSWGSYWGDLGFFKVLRGENLMRIESDCWFVKVDLSGEEAVKRGEYVGGMYGLREKPTRARNVDLSFNRALHVKTTSSRASAGIGTEATGYNAPYAARPEASTALRTSWVWSAAMFAAGALLGVFINSRASRRATGYAPIRP